MHNLPKMTVCYTAAAVCLHLKFFNRSFFQFFILSVSKPYGFVQSEDRALKFGSLLLCVGIFIFTLKFAHAYKTLRIMDGQNYNVFDPLALFEQKNIKLVEIWHTQVLT